MVLAALLVIIIDAATKIAGAALLPSAPKDLVRGVSLRVVHNRGVAFGLGHHTSGRLLVPATAALAALVAAVVWRRASGSGAAAGLFVGGLLANAADRALGGSVVELIHIGWWPPINLADILLTVGLVLLLSDVLSAGHDGGQAPRPQTSDANATSSREPRQSGT